MAMNPLTKESGGTEHDRCVEAHKIMYGMDLYGHVEEMSSNERDFVEGLYDKMEQFGNDCFVSAKQLFWLRDLKEKYL